MRNCVQFTARCILLATLGCIYSASAAENPDTAANGESYYPFSVFAFLDQPAPAETKQSKAKPAEAAPADANAIVAEAKKPTAGSEEKPTVDSDIQKKRLDGPTGAADIKKIPFDAAAEAAEAKKEDADQLAERLAGVNGKYQKRFLGMLHIYTDEEKAQQPNPDVLGTFYTSESDKHPGRLYLVKSHKPEVLDMLKRFDGQTVMVLGKLRNAEKYLIIIIVDDLGPTPRPKDRSGFGGI